MSSPSGTVHGVKGATGSDGTDAAGILEKATSSSGTVRGVKGSTGSIGANATGVLGEVTNDFGTGYGVRGATASTIDGADVYGEASNTSTVGVRGVNTASEGTAVDADGGDGRGRGGR